MKQSRKQIRLKKKAMRSLLKYKCDIWGHSSTGRASALQAEGCGFESHLASSPNFGSFKKYEDKKLKSNET